MESRTQGDAVLAAVVLTLQEHRQYLSELDGAAGDGDHGVNMAKGAKIAARAGAERAGLTCGQALQLLADSMQMIGGSMGPLYGSLFAGLAEGAPASGTVSRDDARLMIGTAKAKVHELTPAKPGDKTLIDVLDPAVAAFEQARLAGNSLNDCLDAMTTAAEDGVTATATMAARIGRAARLGQRSIGHIDAGAASCSLILHALATAIQEPTREKGE